MRNGKQTRSAQVSFQTREESGVKRIEGYFSTFSGQYEIWPGAVETIDPHAFDGAINDDVRALIDHETRLVLGRTTAGTLQLRVDEHGLWGSIVINENDTDAMNLYARVQRGDVNQCSFGFEILEEDTEYNAAGYDVHWTIKRVKLYEVSCVTFPAYEDTSIAARTSAEYKEIQRRKNAAWKNSMKERMKKWH